MLKNSQFQTTGAAVIRAGILSGMVIGTTGVFSENLPTPDQPRSHTMIFPSVETMINSGTFAATSVQYQPQESLPKIVEAFYLRLSAQQEPLGAEFEAALGDSLWDLYAS